MKQNLRLIFLTLICAVFGTAWGEEKSEINLTNFTQTLAFSDFSKMGSSYTTNIQGAFPASDGNSYSGWTKTDCMYNADNHALLQMKKSTGQLISPTVITSKGFTVKVTYGAQKGISLSIGEDEITGEYGGSL